MHDDIAPHLRPEDEAPDLHQLLSSLSEFEPAPGFDDRVLAQVYRPGPRWLQSLQRASRAVLTRRRVRWLAGGMIATSAASVAASAVLAVVFWPAIADTSLSLYETHLAPPLTRLMGGTTPVGLPALTYGAIWVTGFLTSCWLGLHEALRAQRRHQIPIRATH